MTMSKRTLWLAVFSVVLLSLLFFAGALNSITQGSDSGSSGSLLPEPPEVNTDADPTDMSLYYAMGEYYPPDTIDTININWMGGRVEIVAYTEDYYFVEESATRQLDEDERLSYVLSGNEFYVYYKETEDVELDDVYKKLEIRVPMEIAENLSAVNISNSGEVVLKNISAESITIYGYDNDITLNGVTASELNITDNAADVTIGADDSADFTLVYGTQSGEFSSELDCDFTGGVYTFGMGTGAYSVTTVSGSLRVSEYHSTE